MSKKRVALVIALILFVFVGLSYGAATSTGKDEVKAEEPERHVDCRMVTSADLNDESAPSFEDYKVPVEGPIKHPKVDTETTKIGHMFRTVLRNGIKSGPNYAGHYTVVVWGCGTSCSSFAVVNLKTGQVITSPGIDSLAGNHLNRTIDQFLPEGGSDYWGYRYRPDSRLLVLIGGINEDGGEGRCVLRRPGE